MANLLVIDDSPSQITLYRQMLEKHGHHLLIAEDGAAGIAVAKTHKPDLILMDVVMPELNGFQATRKLSHDPETAHIPIIMVTTKDQPTDKVWGERQGAKGYLAKPVKETELVALIDRFLV
ncbi:MAG: response regulator [Saccharospirillum sp.]